MLVMLAPNWPFFLVPKRDSSNLNDLIPAHSAAATGGFEEVKTHGTSA